SRKIGPLSITRIPPVAASCMSRLRASWSTFGHCVAAAGVAPAYSALRSEANSRMTCPLGKPSTRGSGFANFAVICSSSRGSLGLRTFLAAMGRPVHVEKVFERVRELAAQVAQERRAAHKWRDRRARDSRHELDGRIAFRRPGIVPRLGGEPAPVVARRNHDD